MNDIINNRRKYIPPELYRYRAINPNESLEKNKHVNALINDKTYLTNPYFFNDPYDSAFSIDIDLFKNSLIKNAEQQIKKTIVKIELEKNNIDINQVENIEMIYNDINIDLSKADNFFERNIPTFYEALIKQIKFKISCFSENQKSILMWSHYANQHQGFCIGYDISKIEEEIRENIYPVFYHDRFFQLIKTSNLNDRKFNSLIKYKDWKYEQEWRLIYNKKFVSIKPSKIYLGVRFNDEYIDLFKDIANEKNCKLYKMKMNYSRYILEYEEIE